MRRIGLSLIEERLQQILPDPLIKSREEHVERNTLDDEWSQGRDLLSILSEYYCFITESFM